MWKTDDEKTFGEALKKDKMTRHFEKYTNVELKIGIDIITLNISKRRKIKFKVDTNETKIMSNNICIHIKVERSLVAIKLKLQFFIKSENFKFSWRRIF